MIDIDKSGIPPFDCNGDRTTQGPRWKNFVLRVENYFKAASFPENEDEKRAAALLHIAGGEVHDLYNDTLSNNPVADNIKTEYGKVKARLTTHFDVKRSKWVEWVKYRNLEQKPDETVERFYTRLLQAATYCGFGNKEDELIGQIIMRCKSDKLRRQLLQKDDITLEKVLEMARAHDCVEEQARLIEGDNETNVNAIGATSAHSSRKPCRYCGSAQYPHDVCPARGKTCTNCQKRNHFASVCESQASSNPKRSHKPLYRGKRPNRPTAVTLNSIQELDNWYAMFTVQDGQNNLPYTTVKINNTPVHMMVDTGCSAVVIDEHTYQSMKPKPPLMHNSRPIYTYNASEKLASLGQFRATIAAGSKQLSATITVVRGGGGCLLGYNASTSLGIVSMINTITKAQPTKSSLPPELAKYASMFPSVFSGNIGKLKDFELSLHIDSSVKPVRQAHRSTPFHLRPLVEERINELLEQDIIEPVLGQPTPWLSHIVIVPKDNGSIRLCTDSRQVNRAIQREKHQMPTLEEIVQAVHKPRSSQS